MVLFSYVKKVMFLCYYVLSQIKEGMKLKDRFKKLRKEFKLTQEEFANSMDLSRSYINLIEMGRKVPSKRTIKDICHTFKVNYDWLAYGTGSMFQSNDAQDMINAIPGRNMNTRIQQIRKAERMTQDEFAEKIGLSRNFVWMIEKGERIPSKRTLKDICRVFKINYDWLVHGSGEMFQDYNDIIPDTIPSISDADEEFIKATLVKLIKLDPKYWHMIREIFEELQKL